MRSHRVFCVAFADRQSCKRSNRLFFCLLSPSFSTSSSALAAASQFRVFVDIIGGVIVADVVDDVVADAVAVVVADR